MEMSKLFWSAATTPGTILTIGNITPTVPIVVMPGCGVKPDRSQVKFMMYHYTISKLVRRWGNPVQVEHCCHGTQQDLSLSTVALSIITQT